MGVGMNLVLNYLLCFITTLTENFFSQVGDAFEEYEAGLMEHGPKMVILNTIVEECLKVGDKILVFR